ncbi:MAG: oligopeptide transporter, OPT family [Thermoanaerobaculia bacterium]|nr:oligopeptide transporter, OPT family [Thermoanaerobaculia bacterium]
MASQTTASGVVRRGPYPEITWPAILVGYVIGALIAVSIGYLSLKLGFSIEGSELAAILGFGVLRGVMRRKSIIENNINQTLASSVNGASAGMMFSIPAIFILGYTDFNRLLVVVACIAGGVLGIAFIIPLRKQMIDFDRLAYPGGIATAAVLKAPGAGIRKAQLLVGAAVVSGLLHLASLSTGVENFDLGALVGMPAYMNGIWYLSLLTIGTAFLAGRGGFFFVIGGYVCYWVLAPILAARGLLPGPAELEAAGMGVASFLRVNLFRPVGIGMIIGGAMTGIVLALPLVRSAIRSMQDAAKVKSAVSTDELPIKLLYMGVAGAFALLAVTAVLSVAEIEIWRAVLMALLGTLWVWVAGIILSECIGRTQWSPLSGMTLIGVTILIFVASGMGDRQTVVASIVVGAAMCVAMAQATDLMLDLKTGYLVGAIPRKQQIAQFLGTWLGPILIMGLIVVLHRAYGMGSEQLPAPQGQALATVIQGILGGDIPLDKYLAGAGLGALISGAGVGGLGVMVGLGFYLPFNIILTYTIGTLLRELSDRQAGRRFSEDVGVPLAAGLIVGEALVGVGYSLSIVFGA